MGGLGMACAWGLGFPNLANKAQHWNLWKFGRWHSSGTPLSQATAIHSITVMARALQTVPKLLLRHLAGRLSCWGASLLAKLVKNYDN
jgi:hypothetical protein